MVSWDGRLATETASSIISAMKMAPLDLSEHAEELEQEKKASRFGDHYFAFFLTCTRHNLRLGSTGC